MKNKTIITIGLIIFLSAALVVKSRGCGSSVPELEGWYEPADGIDVKSKDSALHLVKKDGNWLINEQSYPGDADLIESLERKARDFKLLDLVSDKGYYNKYDLTDENGISVIIRGNGKVLRKILLGKPGSTNNHSYLRVDDRKEIYLASGIMRSDFTIPAADLRNRNIFSISRPDIKSFIINYGGKNFEFIMKNPTSSTDRKDEEKPAVKWICKGYENIILSDSSIDSVLALFSPLKAAEYPENTDKKSAGNILCTVTFNVADKKIELVIYSKKDKDMNYASSSESKYLFTLGTWQTQKLFIRNITDLAVKK